MDNNSVESLLAKLKEVVTCSICMGLLKYPKSLACQHAFCQQCLKEYTERNSYLICPMCKVEETESDIKKLPSAFIQNQLIDILMKNKNETKETLNNYETVTEKMRNNSHYEVVYQKEIQEICQHLHQKISKNFKFDFSNCLVDISDIGYQQIIIVDSNSSQFIVYSELNIRTFYIYLEGKIVIPEYIRFYRGNLILTGKLEIDGKIMSVFLQCSLNGEIIKKSKFYPGSEVSDLPVILGFDINETDDKYYLCMPRSRNIQFYNTFPIESCCCELNDNPEFIAFHSSENQLYVSCPQSKRILILNTEAEVYKTISTIDVIPKMIFMKDEKILFLDEKENRIIWIKMINEQLLYKQLDIPNLNKNFQIKSFHVLPFSKIFIGTKNEIFICQLQNIYQDSTNS